MTNLNSVQRSVYRKRTEQSIFYAKILSLSELYSKRQLSDIKKALKSVYTNGYCDGVISQITK